MDQKPNQYDLIVLTTATSRPDLHNISFSKIGDFLSEYTCKWIIRVDQLNNQDVESTIKNLYRLLDRDNIDLEIIPSGRTASRISWFKSVKWCVDRGFEFKPKYGYFWLEDDWNLHTDKSLKNIAHDILKDIKPNQYISLANRNKELNFNPCIWSIDLFEKYMYKKINAKEMPPAPNAERICTYHNQYPESTKGINYKSINAFYDIGRAWAAKNLKTERTFYL